MRIAFLLLAFLAACKSMASDRLATIQLGMPRADVLERLGEPESRSAHGNTELLKYAWTRRHSDWRDTKYVVRLVDGVVDAFGEEADVQVLTATVKQ